MVVFLQVRFTGAAPSNGCRMILHACLRVGVPHVGVKALISLRREKKLSC